MKNMFKIVLAIFISLGLVLVGCSSSEGESDNNESTNSSTSADKDIVIGVDATFTSMDPHDTNDNLSYSGQSTMIEGLMGFDKDLNLVPVLAEDYAVNDASTEFTFFLREGVSFHDGTAFNAEAVKANIDRLANPDNQLKRHSLFELVEETIVEDEYTVKVVLKEPFGAMLNNFAHPAAAIISPKAIEEYGADVSQHPVGTGPFVFDEWQHGEFLKVVKNEEYWQDGLPKVDSVTFNPAPEDGTRIAMLQTGEADFIYPVPPTEVETIEQAEGLTLENIPSLVVKYISFNTMKEPFDDVRVRQAINYAINKEAYAQVVFNGYATVAKSSIAPNTQFYAEQEGYEYNVEKAKELLKEAGYEDGFETTIWGGNSTDRLKMMEFYKQQLAEVGIKLNVVPMEGGTLGDKIWGVTPEETELEIYNGGWSPSTADADWGLRPLFGGSEAFPPESYNTAYYEKERVRELLTQGLQTADPEKRKEIYAEVQAIIWEEAPWAFLAVPDIIYAKKDAITGIEMLPSGTIDLKQAEVAN